MTGLDGRALFLFMSSVSLAVALFLFLLWRRDRDRHLLVWTVTFLLNAGGHALLGARGVFPDFLSIVVANTMLYAAMLTLVGGLRLFLGAGVGPRRLMVYGLLALACAVALHIHSAYRPDIGVRVCLMSALTGGAAMAVPLMVARDRDRRRRPVDLALAASFLVFGLLIGARIPLALWRPIQGDAHGLPVDLFLLAALQMFMQVFWGVGLVSIHAERVMKQLQDLSNTDELSGLGTRRAVERALAREMERASRTSQPLSVLMLDIDHFKAINDCYGHLAGDAAIRQVGRTITGLLRPYDMAGRFGGDEFCILLPHTAVFQGQSIAQRLCRAEYQVMRDGGEPLGLTVSVGVAAFDPADADPHALIRAADAALYRAKRGGRNQVVSA